MIRALANGIRRHRVYRQTVVELGRLSDRELADLGIGRGQIGTIAREGAARL